MAISTKLKKGEILIYILIWLVVFMMPVFLFQDNKGIDWNRITKQWFHLVPFIVVFLVHNSILFPAFFISKKHLFYFGSTLLLVLAVSTISMFFGREVGPSRGLMPEGPPPIPNQMPEHFMRVKPWQMLMFEDFLSSVLVIGFNVAIKLTIKWQEEEQKNKDLEKEKLATELALLKNQVSPHFFMNTLNNIHALIDINTEDAKESIIKLSKLMRYLLYDSEEGKTTLAKEVEFIRSYVDLMKLRFTSMVEIKLSFPEQIPDIEIPPMLFTSLVENAFKHGISYKSQSFIEIIVNINKEFLFFRIRNSRQNGENAGMEKGGIGLENVRKRLDLLYGKMFTLEQTETETTFEINIKLPVNA